MHFVYIQVIVKDKYWIISFFYVPYNYKNSKYICINNVISMNNKFVVLWYIHINMLYLQNINMYSLYIKLTVL